HETRSIGPRAESRSGAPDDQLRDVTWLISSPSAKAQFFFRASRNAAAITPYPVAFAWMFCSGPQIHVHAQTMTTSRGVVPTSVLSVVKNAASTSATGSPAAA